MQELSTRPEASLCQDEHTIPMVELPVFVNLETNFQMSAPGPTSDGLVAEPVSEGLGVAPTDSVRTLG